MHHIYHTEGLILGSRGYGEAGKYYYLFTRDLGMIYASAQGVRKMSSKLRFILQDYAYIKVDLVQGKDFWRITSASKTNKLGGFASNPPALRVFANVAALLRRLLAGVEPNEPLFKDLIVGLEILEQTASGEDLSNLEAVIVLRVLFNLGYIGGEKSLENITKSPLSSELIFEAAKSRKKLLNEINRALKATHL